MNARTIKPLAIAVVIIVVLGGAWLGGAFSQNRTVTSASNNDMMAENAASSSQAQIQEASIGTAVGQQLPAFTFNTLDGTVQLDELKGAPTVLYFSAVWCVSCRGEIKELATFKDQFKDKLNVVYVDVTPQMNTMNQLRQFSKEYGHRDFVWAMDSQKNPVSTSLQVFALGTSYILDSDNTVAFRGVSSVSTQQFQRILKTLIE